MPAILTEIHKLAVAGAKLYPFFWQLLIIRKRITSFKQKHWNRLPAKCWKHHWQKPPI